MWKLGGTAFGVGVEGCEERPAAWKEAGRGVGVRSRGCLTIQRTTNDDGYMTTDDTYGLLWLGGMFVAR